MNKYKHLSGAAKRRRKAEDEKKKNKFTKLTSFFCKIEKPVENVSLLENEGTSTATASNIANVNEENSDSFKNNNAETSVSNSSNTSESKAIEIKTAECNYVNELQKTDKANFADSVLNDDKKKFIVKYGPCQPTGPFPRNEQGRCFNSVYYFHKSKAGIAYRRNWLCYSPTLNIAYCEPCWVFGERNVGLNDATKEKENWINGYNDWRHISQSIKRHEASNAHLVSCQIYHKWKLDYSIDVALSKELQFEVNYWEQVLHRIINVTLTLALNNQSFRGDKESLENEGNCGNFLNTIRLLSLYDPILQELINKEKGKIKYLSPAIQNEIINILATKVREALIHKINNSPFFSIIIDTTQDVSKIDQISIIIRFIELVHDEEDDKTIKDITVKEVFLGFEAADGQTAESLKMKILECLEKNTLDLRKLRGQGYDGAANMSGMYNGLQARIKEDQPKAVYVHCSAHNLNLVINDAVSSIQEIRDFYDLVENIYVFFGHSISRWAILTSVFETKKYTLKRLCPTRWSSRNEALHSLRFHFTEVLEALTRISLTSEKSNEKNEAASLKKKVENFEFVMLVILESKILNSANTVSKALQSKHMDIEKALELLENTYVYMLELRKNFDEIMTEATRLANSWHIDLHFQNKRQIKVKKFYDELCSDHRLVNSETNFKVRVFYGTLDIIISQLKRRFFGLKDVVQKFKVIFPSTLATATDEELVDMAEKLASEYPDDVSMSLGQEILRFRNIFKNQLPNNVRDLSKMAIIDYDTLSSSYRDVCTVLILFLTIPVSVASAERSFSKLKIIKNYLRSSMGQQRLSDLAVLSIENEEARKLDLKNVIKYFASVKARRTKI